MLKVTKYKYLKNVFEDIISTNTIVFFQACLHNLNSFLETAENGEQTNVEFKKA